MKTIFFDLKNGISGDMAVAALLNMNIMPLEEFYKNLSSLEISDEFLIEYKNTEKFGITGGDFFVIDKNEADKNHQDSSSGHMSKHEHEHEHQHDEHKHEHKRISGHFHGRHLQDIIKIINRSEISEAAKDLSLKIFDNLAAAESRAHNKDKDEIHFHEVGAVDSIVDIVGFSVLYTHINPDSVICTDVNLGKGTVKCSHGILNVPAPAVVNLVSGMPVYCDEAGFEMTTPTGAAIIKTIEADFKNEYKGKLICGGAGFGKRDMKSRPNCLNVLLLEDGGLKDSSDIIEITANIDNTTAEDLGFCAKALLQSGALDVSFCPVFMKKFRPGYKLEVLCKPADLKKLSKIIFENTKTIGLRYSVKQRIVLERKEGTKDTKLGKIKTKTVYFNNNKEDYLEYDSLEEVCLKNSISIKEGRKL